MIEAVTFWPRWRALTEVFSAEHAVISITCPHQALAPLKGDADILRLQFYDLVKPALDDPRFGPETLFTADDADKVMEFVSRIHSTPGARKLVVHCEAGLSRSPAIALFVAAATGCAFPNSPQADRANKHVVQVLSERSGVNIPIPPPLPIEPGVILLAANSL